MMLSQAGHEYLLMRLQTYPQSVGRYFVESGRSSPVDTGHSWLVAKSLQNVEV
jgi:hypothetical protein